MKVKLNSISCCWYHKGTNFQANHNSNQWYSVNVKVVADTTKVRIFKQITTGALGNAASSMLLLIPQRYEFSSKSQLLSLTRITPLCCCWYHKGTNFQANHNFARWYVKRGWVVADTTKVRIFKQITTSSRLIANFGSCCWYHKGTNFQANHNFLPISISQLAVVADTTKVRIFKQITTERKGKNDKPRCCWYHKGTNFQANHNAYSWRISCIRVVADTTKVRIFKQITTTSPVYRNTPLLLLIPQRYEFSSKSQLIAKAKMIKRCCCWYHKGTNFQANHN